MKIELSDNELQVATEKATMEAVKGAIGGWEVSNLIKQKATDAILGSAIEETIKAAVDSADMTKLTKAITAEIERTVVSLATHTIRNAMAVVIYEMRKGDKYDTSDDRAKKLLAILAEIDREEGGRG